MSKSVKYTSIVVAIMLCLALLVGCAPVIGGAVDGTDGESAYGIAVRNGFTGTETEWLASLKGTDGADGVNGEVTVVQSLYAEAVENGFEGTYFEFLEEYIKGDVGAAGYSNITYASSKSVLSVVSVYSNFTVVTGRYQTAGSSAGSGVIVKDDKTTGTAYIITNYHVVYNSSSTTGVSDDIYVYLYGMEYPQYKLSAEYIGGSLQYDIAVIKVTNSDIYKNSDARAATVVDSDDVIVGSTAIAIGNPSAGGISVSSGVVSVDSEYISMTGADDVTTVEFRVMRVDTAINSGNSGGGLFDGNGNLIGIVNAKITSSSVENIGFAIPSNIAIGCFENIVRNCEGQDNKQMKRCMVGVTLEIAESRAVYSETTKLTTIENTIKVQSVVTDGAAAGKLRVGDVIESFMYDGKTVEVNRLFTIVDYSLRFEKNIEVVFNIIRDGAAAQVTVTLTSETTVK